MKLQRGNFIPKNTEELLKQEPEEDGIKRVIDLAYMGQIEYEGNAIPISRMYIEYFLDKYIFYPTEIFNANNERMYIYVNGEMVEKNDIDLNKLAKNRINDNYTLYEYLHYPNKEYVNDFWWNIHGDYFIFFGEEKKELINYFINTGYERDGQKEGIKRKLEKVGYKLE